LLNTLLLLAVVEGDLNLAAVAVRVAYLQVLQVWLLVLNFGLLLAGVAPAERQALEQTEITQYLLPQALVQLQGVLSP
jgi:hypothetical protein